MSPTERKKKNNVIPQMFDVRPADVADDLAMGKKIESSQTVRLFREEKSKERQKLKINFTVQKKSVEPKKPVIRRRSFYSAKMELGKTGVIQMNRLFLESEALPPYIKIKSNCSDLPAKKTGLQEHCIGGVRKKKDRQPQLKNEVARKQKPLFFETNRIKNKNLDEKGFSYEFGTRNNLPSQDEKYARFFGSGQNDKETSKFEPEPASVRKPLAIFSRKKEKHSKNKSFSFADIFKINSLSLRPALGFAVLSVMVFSFILCAKFASYGWQKKDDIMVKGVSAVAQLAKAKDEIASQNFQGAEQNIKDAKASFESAKNELDQIGGNLSHIFSALPFLSKISTGKNLLSAGEEISLAAEKINQTIAILNELENPLDGENQKNIGDILMTASEKILQSKDHLEKANDHFQGVKTADLPQEFQASFSKGKEALPEIIKLIEKLEENYQILYEIFGYNGPRKYLFLFQNNQEMRATGGFIGSYGVLSIDNGKVESLLIDGIFNPDGQLYEKVVPPAPIQKISAAWSTHDANWFPNFPTSAEKIAWFYEKTGGPTVDGIITVTPTVLEKLLQVTGPIEMPEYETTVDENNFVENTQYEVEVDYDKEENRPKKFIADLAPKIFEKVFASRDPQDISKTMKIIGNSLEEKHILIYSFDYNIQKLISRHGWSGEILQTNKDYLMVVNSNINGYKTDGVVDETITHQAEIQPDGTIIDTVKIKRVHNGGSTDFDWWNKVNSNYMRVYVPKGSELLEARGHTREFNQSPLDYDALNFKRDNQVQREEQNMKIDEASGTRIYEEENKTVFANWVYVSPKEIVEVEYKYRLPFKVDFSKNEDKVDSYSILFQKQSGSIGSELDFRLVYPEKTGIIWSFPQQKDGGGKTFDLEEKLSSDKFFGAVLQKKQQ